MSQSTPDKRGPRIPFQPNPFASAALGSPWNAVTDVAGIHDEPFKKILGALRQLQAGSGSTSIVVTGEPGSGKTHLLWRLRNRLDQDENQERGATAYVYVRCNASAATLWRHVQYSLASDLLKSRPTQPSRLDFLLRQQPDRLDRVENLALRRALECLREGRHFHVASAWLRGETLADADLVSLGIAAENDGEDRNREAEAMRIIDALLRFIAPIPTVLCFDQVEGLETYRGEDAGFHVLGQLISALIDKHEHLLLISCIVSTYEGKFDLLTKADRDRWRKEQVNLRPIEWEQAEQLVRARLEGAPALAGQRRERPNEVLWPLNAEALKTLFTATGVCLSRTLIQACDQQFKQLLGDDEPRPTRSREDFLQEEYQRNLAEARIIVQRQGADKTLSECLPWLLQNSGMKQMGQSAERSGFVHVAFTGALGDTGLVFCTRGGNDLTNKLKKAEGSWKNPNSLRLKILRDASVKPGKKASELLVTLRERGAQEIHALPEALAALQAIRNMTASASAGDLVQDGEAISQEEVTSWALANLPPQLEKLRDDLAGRPRADATLSRLSALVSQHKIIEAETAARELSLTTEEVSACARRNPLEFGLLEGPPLVFFQAVEGRSAAETTYA